LSGRFSDLWPRRGGKILKIRFHTDGKVLWDTRKEGKVIINININIHSIVKRQVGFRRSTQCPRRAELLSPWPPWPLWPPPAGQEGRWPSLLPRNELQVGDKYGLKAQAQIRTYFKNITDYFRRLRTRPTPPRVTWLKDIYQIVCDSLWDTSSDMQQYSAADFSA